MPGKGFRAAMKVEDKTDWKGQYCSCGASGLWGRTVHSNNNENSLRQKNVKRRKLMREEINDRKAS